MRKYLDAKDMENILRKLKEDLAAEEERLTELDSVIGDGDLGMTLTIGFHAIEDCLSAGEFSTVSEVLSESADAFSEKAASTFGTLLTVMMKKAGRAARSFDRIGTPELASMFEAAIAEVQKRGKAQLGDKTLLDALIPASEELRKAAENDLDLDTAVEQAAAAAGQGAENTVNLKARTGRAGYLGGRTVGQMDPGAYAISLMIRSLSDYICSQGE